MLALGIILILLSAGALVVALTSGSGEHATLFSGNVELPTFVVFLAGAATLLVFIMGLEMFRSGIRRANRNRKDSRRLRKLEQREEQRGPSGEPTGERTTGSGEPHETPPPPASRPPTT
jgi:putative Mn2+ efflux pump MntP